MYQDVLAITEDMHQIFQSELRAPGHEN